FRDRDAGLGGDVYRGAVGASSLRLHGIDSEVTEVTLRPAQAFGHDAVGVSDALRTDDFGFSLELGTVLQRQRFLDGHTTRAGGLSEDRLAVHFLCVHLVFRVAPH